MITGIGRVSYRTCIFEFFDARISYPGIFISHIITEKKRVGKYDDDPLNNLFVKYIDRRSI